MKSLKSKLVLTYTTVILAMLVGLGSLFIFTTKNNATKDTHDTLMEMSKQEAEYVKARIDERLTYMESLAQNPILLDENMSFDEKVAFFEKEAQRTGYLAFAFADKNGDATVFNSKRETTNIGSREYFQTALSGKSAVSDIIISSATGELVLIFASPVYQNGEIIGVVYGRRDGSALCEIVSGSEYKKTGYAYMVNNQGTTVAHKNIDLVLAQDNDIENMKTDSSLKELGELTQKMLSRTVGSGTYSYKGVKKIVAYSPVENTPWILAFGLEESEALAEVKAQSKMLWIFVLVSSVIGAAITYVISSTIVNPIKKVTNVAQEIAQGNFDVTLTVDSKDEVGKLAESFNQTLVQLNNYQDYIDEISDSLEKIGDGDLQIVLEKEYAGQFKKLKDNLEALVEHLSETLLQIQQSSEQVDSGALQIANGAQALSQGATEQASSIAELSSSIANVTEQVKQNADSAKQARDKAGSAGTELENSNTQMQNMMSSMNDITGKAAEISKIIKIIDDIAFQTNILALNAAVEAARAGAAGKGFAVVADEVRNLAAKSAEAARNTSVLIEETIDSVNSGSAIAQETAKSLIESAQKAMEAIKLIDNIALASQDQAIAISQVNLGVEQISSVIETNAATAEESAAASEELSGQSNVLKDLVSTFNFRQSDFFTY